MFIRNVTISALNPLRFTQLRSNFLIRGKLQPISYIFYRVRSSIIIESLHEEKGYKDVIEIVAP